MKTSRIIGAFVAAVVVAATLSCQTVNDILKRIQCDPGSTMATAFFEQCTVIDKKVYAQPWESISWTTGSTRTITYTYQGKTFTEPYAQVMAAVVAIAYQERKDPSPAALSP